MEAAEAVFAYKAGCSDPASLGPGPGLDSGQSQSHGTAQPAAVPCPPAADGPVQKRQRRNYNAAQTAALQLEAQKAARGETRASNRDLAAQISELGGGRVVTGQDVGNWFRNQQGKKRQRAGAGGDEADQAPCICPGAGGVNESC